MGILATIAAGAALGATLGGSIATIAGGSAVMGTAIGTVAGAGVGLCISAADGADERSSSAAPEQREKG